MSADTFYRVVPSPFYLPSFLALAKRYTALEDAFRVMGEGMVVDSAGEVVAFHERHLDLLERRAAWKVA